MSTRDIRPALTHATCEVCGRTLLRGERAQVYLDGADRRSVCELCTSRALDEGWVREGSVPTFDPRDGGSDRRSSLLRRLRSRRPKLAPNGDVSDLDGSPDAEPRPPARAPRPRWRAGSDQSRGRSGDQPREPRHVHAIPTGVEQRIAAAIDVFNGSEHRRTVAGVARSLGVPEVSVLPIEGRPGLVHIVVAWELCWYRYETDLSDEVPGVRLEGQGYELDELDDLERQPNAGSDEHGTLGM